jgi:hypothetical protein
MERQNTTGREADILKSIRDTLALLDPMSLMKTTFIQFANAVKLLIGNDENATQFLSTNEVAIRVYDLNLY